MAVQDGINKVYTTISQSIGMSNVGNTSGTTGMVSGNSVQFVMAGGNNITLSQSINGSSGTITISGANQTAQTQNVHNVTLSGNTAGAMAQISSGTMTIAGGNNITLSQAGNAITISGANTVAQSVQPGIQSISGGTTRVTTGEVVFSNSNGLAFGVNGNTITGSYTVPTVTNSSMTVSDAATSGTVGRLAFTNLNGVTLSLSTGAGGSHTIVGSHNALTSQSNQALSGSNGSFAFQTATFGNLNGMSFYTSNGSMVGSYTVPTQSNAGFSASGGSSTFQTLSFNNANGFTFSNVAGAVQGSYTVPTITNSSMTISDAATSGTLARLAFTNLNGITFSLSTGAAGSHTIVGSHNALTSQSNQAFSAGGGVSTFQTLGFSDNAYVSFTNSNGSVAINEIRGSYFATGNTTQSSSGAINADTVVFRGSGAVSVGVSNGSIIFDAPSAAAGNVTFSAGTTSNGLASIVFSNANGVSFGLDGSTITASAAGGGGGGIAAAAGTQTGNTGTIVFSNSNNITFGMSNNSVITASVSLPSVELFFPEQQAVQVATQQGQGSYHISPYPVMANVTFDRLVIPLNFTHQAASTGTFSGTFMFGIYTKNASTLSLLSSTSTLLTQPWASTLSSSAYSGPRLYTIGLSGSLSAGQYWFGFASVTSSSSALMSVSHFAASRMASSMSGLYGAATNTTMQSILGQGRYTATTVNSPNSIAFSQIQGQSTAFNRPPIFYLINSTV